jgi:hypothetical protein
MPLLSEGCRRDLFFSASETRPDVPENPTFEFGMKSVLFSETPQYAAFPRLSGLSGKKGAYKSYFIAKSYFNSV